MDIESENECHLNCFFQAVIGRGDLSNVIVYGEHTIAVNARNLRIQFNNDILSHGAKK